MRAIIYKPTRSAAQSGTANSCHWILLFEHDGSREIEPVMGWTASCDMMQEVQLKFNSLDEAKIYAEKHKIDYEVIEPQEHRLIIRTYAENFK